MYSPYLHVLVGLVTSSTATNPSANFKDKCTTLANNVKLDYPFTVNVAQYLPPNATIDLAAEGRNATCIEYQMDPYPIPVGVCRFSLKVTTSNTSETYVEVWLPEKWEGRVLTTGNGGFNGCIGYTTLSYGASTGFASIGTNAGHNGTSASALYQHPEVLEDLSWRSVYVGTTVGKSIAKQLYEKDTHKSYYVGCSMGGRQGWKAIQKNPEIFDGVIAGAPGIDLYAHLSFFGFAFETLGSDANNTLVSLPQWTAIKTAVLDQCDDLDGARDGIVENPDFCKFDWAAVSCATSSTSTCLTPTQIYAASKLFAPVTYNGTVIHPTGQFHGVDVELITWLYLPFAQAWVPESFQYLIYQDLSWDPSTYTLADAYRAKQLDRGDLSTLTPDISAFRNRGGKVLHWHGTADPLLSLGISDKYYSSVQTHFNATTAELDTFYRYFHAGGVMHCTGGPGASVMGQQGGQVAGAGAEDNMMARIVEWVEKGDAPEFVRGTKFVDDVIGGEVEFRRKHCKFPMVNVYKGVGDGKDEEGWECVDRY